MHDEYGIGIGKHIFFKVTFNLITYLSISHLQLQTPYYIVNVDVILGMSLYKRFRRVYKLSINVRQR